MSIERVLGESAPELMTCQPSDALLLAIDRLVDNNLNAIAVVDDERLAGILTDHDIMRAMRKTRGKIDGERVDAWMTKDVITCVPETKLTEALRMMGQYRIRHLIVAIDDRPVALLGIRGILARIHEHDELEINVLRDMAIAARAAVTG